MKLRTFKSASLTLVFVYAITVSSGYLVWNGHNIFGTILAGIGIAVFVSLMVLFFGWYTCPRCKKWLGSDFKKVCSHCGSEITNDTEIGV